MWFLSLFQTNYKKRAARSGIPQMLTIPYSPYNELARWSWEASGKQFEEHRFAPGGHMLPVTSLRVPNDLYSDSSYVQHVKTIQSVEKVDEEVMTKRVRSSRSSAVPLMVMPDGSFLKDSWAIVAASGLPQITDADFKRTVDEELGTLARQHAYMYLLRDCKENRRVWDELCSASYGLLWWILWWTVLRKIVTERMIKVFQPHNEAANAECKAKLRVVFAKLSKQIESRNTKYLYGDTLGAADLAVASMAAVVVYPDSYCGGVYQKSFSRLQQVDAELPASIAEFRATPLGQYTLHIYRTHR